MCRLEDGGEVPRSSITTEIAELCVFRCPQCPGWETPTYYGLCKHLKAVHGESAKFDTEAQIKEAR